MHRGHELILSLIEQRNYKTLKDLKVCLDHDFPIELRHRWWFCQLKIGIDNDPMMHIPVTRDMAGTDPYEHEPI